MDIDYSKLKELWKKEEENFTFKGWDFSYLDKRWVTKLLQQI